MQDKTSRRQKCTVSWDINFSSIDRIKLIELLLIIHTNGVIKVTLFSMYSSQCKPRLVTIRGVPSSTGEMSILNFCGAAVTTCNKGYYFTYTYYVNPPGWCKPCSMYY